MDNLIRQNERLPAPDKCYVKTIYPLQKGDSDKKYITDTCAYFEDGKCQLNGCIKNFGEESEI